MELRVSRTRRSGAERRREILEAALAICLEEGIAALRTEKIARRVGLSPGGIFRHYPSKRAILTALTEGLLSRLEAATPKEGEPLRWLRAFVVNRVRAFQEDPGLRLLFSPEFEHALPRAAKAELKKNLRATWNRLVAAVEEGQRRGEIRGDLAAEELAAAVAALVQAATQPLLAEVIRESDPERVWQTVRDLLTR